MFDEFSKKTRFCIDLLLCCVTNFIGNGLTHFRSGFARDTCLVLLFFSGSFLVRVSHVLNVSTYFTKVNTILFALQTNLKLRFSKIIKKISKFFFEFESFENSKYKKDIDETEYSFRNSNSPKLLVCDVKSNDFSLTGGICSRSENIFIYDEEIRSIGIVLKIFDQVFLVRANRIRENRFQYTCWRKGLYF